MPTTPNTYSYYVGMTNRLASIKYTTLLVAFSLFTATYIVYAYTSVRLIAPPNANCSLRELSLKIPPPSRIAMVTDSGLDRIVWIASPPALTIHSGPPCYILDENCRLIDWTPETGQGWRFDTLCQRAHLQPPTTLDELLNRCEK